VRRRIAFLLLAGLLCFFVEGVVWLVICSPLFRLQEIIIQGSGRVSSTAIIDVAQSQMGRGNRSWNFLLGTQSLLAWPSEFDAKSMTLLPSIKSVTISKDFSGRKVYVTISERLPEGVWCLAIPTASSTDGIARTPSCWWFDERGFLFARAPTAEGSIVHAVYDYSGRELGLSVQALAPEFMPNLLSVFSALETSGVGAQELRLNNVDLEEVEAWTQSGTKLYFSLRFPATNTAEVIQRFLFPNASSSNVGSRPQYIDFRVENRAYYK
jgi:hypothetical protein